MKTAIFISILFLAFPSCHNSKKQTNESQEATAQVSRPEDPQEALKPEGGQEEEYTITDDEGRIYSPYDFPLEMEPLKALLGQNIAIHTQHFEDEYFPEGYTFIKITYKDTELAFYDMMEGKHRAHITTPKLSVLGGIKIGTPKKEFIKAMRFDDDNAIGFNIFNLRDDYGAMTFSFRKDTLYLIDGYYEEGD